MNELQFYLKAQGISPEEVAQKTGYSIHYVSNLLNGSDVMNGSARLRLIQAFPGIEPYLELVPKHAVHISGSSRLKQSIRQHDRYCRRREAGLCTDCGQPRDRSGLVCSTCREKAQKRQRRRRATEHGKDNMRKWKLSEKFELAVDEYEQMLRLQNGVCGICGGVNQNGDHLCVDHTNGRVRELLCHSCNKFLGNLETDRSKFHRPLETYPKLAKYLKYLKKWGSI